MRPNDGEQIAIVNSGQVECMSGCAGACGCMAVLPAEIRRRDPI